MIADSHQSIRSSLLLIKPTERIVWHLSWPEFVPAASLSHSLPRQMKAHLKNRYVKAVLLDFTLFLSALEVHWFEVQAVLLVYGTANAVFFKSSQEVTEIPHMAFVF